MLDRRDVAGSGIVGSALAHRVNALEHDAFPTTQQTWLGQKLACGDAGRPDVNRHIMDVYSHPLQVYLTGFGARSLGPPADVVAGFFADRLSRSDYLVKWRQSGMRLRRWLMTGFCFYVREQRRASQQIHSTDDRVDALPLSDGPVAAVERAFVESIVSRSLKLTQEKCERDGFASHWGVFVRHYVSGHSFENVALEFSVTRERAAVMSRTVARRFRTILRSLLACDGVGPDGLDAEIRSLLEEIHR